MNHSLWRRQPYFRHVSGQLVLGSITGILMNTAIVLPAILLGQAIDRALAYARGAAAIEAGRMVETGSPEELLRCHGRFAGLVEIEATGWDWRL